MYARQNSETAIGSCTSIMMTMVKLIELKLSCFDRQQSEHELTTAFTERPVAEQADGGNQIQC